MIIKDAILKSLEEIETPSNSTDVGNHIIKNGYYDFKDAKTPLSTVSAMLGEFIRSNDTRVKRFLKKNGLYYYYLTKYEDKIDLSKFIDEAEEVKSKTVTKEKGYYERDLHMLLSTYLNSTGVYSKTIFHEESLSNIDSNQIWVHPDMVGAQFLNLQTRASQALLKSINKMDIIKLNSYEIKKEINSDTELKKAFFQAVSNSSWANYSYLVAYDISNSLNEEMERLNQSFGIGIIRLDSNPFRSQLLYPPKYRDLDFRTIDKLARINSAFEKFLDQVDKVIVADERYLKPVQKELEEFCDEFFKNEDEAIDYCVSKKIPVKIDLESLNLSSIFDTSSGYHP